MTIDLRSDTLTKPSQAMLEAMMSAEVGDDVFGEDPTVNKLQDRSAELFGMEAGLFCPSGTMTNQIAIKVHTQPGQEVICDESSHIYNYEGGGIAYNSGCSIKPVAGDRGRINKEQILDNINPEDDHFPVTRLVCLENSCNKGGGSYYSLKQMTELSKTAREHGLQTHLDGARIFNALAESGDKSQALGELFDSISYCLSKGLGTPAGSLLLGSKDFIHQAHRIRKVMGGGMRQAGYLAAAGLYALENNVERLSEDHARAKEIAEVLADCDFVAELIPVETNILIFELKPDRYTADAFLNKLEEKDVKAVPIHKQTVRFVTHLDFTEEMKDKLLEILKTL